MSEPLVSVVVPTFQRASVLRRAVDSVLGQTMRDLELIVVDDGSTDGTGAALEDIDDDRLRCIRQPNQGVSSARNAGTRVARGRVITFLDSDDEALPRWLEAIAEPFRDPRCLLVCCSLRSINPNEATERVRRPAPSAANGPAVLFLPGAFALRRSVLDETGGYLEGLAYSENTELGMRIVDHVGPDPGRAAVVDEVLVVMHRQDSGGALPHRAESILRIVDEHRERFARDRSRLARWLAIAGVDFARSGQLTDARRLFAAAWRAEPLRLRHALRLLAASMTPVAKRVWRRQPRR